MSDPVLPLLVAIIIALMALGVVASLLDRPNRQVVGFTGAGLAGLGFVLVMLTLVLGLDADTLILPFGPPNQPLRLMLDPLTRIFLAPAFLIGTVCIAHAAETRDATVGVSLAGLVFCLAGLVLALLAVDGISLVLGVALTSGAIWASGTAGSARVPQLATAALACLCLLAARGLGEHPNMQFVLTLTSAIALAGLPPLHAWLAAAHQATPSRATAMLVGGLQPLVVYILIRTLLSIIAPPPWWGVVVLLVGAASSLISAWRAAHEPELDASLAGLTRHLTGLALIGLGLWLLGRAADLSGMTEMAMAAVLLTALTQSVCGTLAHLTAGALRSGAGSKQLLLLGGLIQTMPVATACLGAALLGLIALPFGMGFALLWLLFQALLAGPSGWWLAGVALVLVVSAGLSSVASVRLFGIACLGRPRIPRAAGATDITRLARPGLIVLSAIGILLGLCPGIILWLAGLILGASSGGANLPWSLGLPGYHPLPLALLAGGLYAAGRVWLRSSRVRPPRSSPAWNDGFAPSPAWLPFGDPLTQSSGSGFLPALRKTPWPAIGWPKMRGPKMRGISTRMAGLPLLLMAAALLLGVLAWIRPA